MSHGDLLVHPATAQSTHKMLATKRPLGCDRPSQLSAISRTTARPLVDFANDFSIRSIAKHCKESLFDSFRQKANAAVHKAEERAIHMPTEGTVVVAGHLIYLFLRHRKYSFATDVAVDGTLGLEEDTAV